MRSILPLISDKSEAHRADAMRAGDTKMTNCFSFTCQAYLSNSPRFELECYEVAANFKTREPTDRIELRRVMPAGHSPGRTSSTTMKAPTPPPPTRVVHVSLPEALAKGPPPPGNLASPIL